MGKRIPYSYENDRDKKSETLYNHDVVSSISSFRWNANEFTTDEFAIVRDGLDKSFDIVGHGYNNLRKQWNSVITVYIYGITKCEIGIVTIRIFNQKHDFMQYITTVGRLKDTLATVYADLKAYEEEFGQDFVGKFSKKTIFM